MSEHVLRRRAQERPRDEPRPGLSDDDERRVLGPRDADERFGGIAVDRDERSPGGTALEPRATTRCPFVPAIAAARSSARVAASDPSKPTTTDFVGSAARGRLSTSQVQVAGGSLAGNDHSLMSSTLGRAGAPRSLSDSVAGGSELAIRSIIRTSGGAVGSRCAPEPMAASAGEASMAGTGGHAR
jgi:hypothetical protein